MLFTVVYQMLCLQLQRQFVKEISDVVTFKVNNFQ